MLNRREFFHAGAACLAPSLLAQNSPRLNVVQILADDTGYGDPHCYGGEIEASSSGITDAWRTCNGPA